MEGWKSGVKGVERLRHGGVLKWRKGGVES